METLADTRGTMRKRRRETENASGREATREVITKRDRNRELREEERAREGLLDQGWEGCRCRRHGGG